MSPKLKRTVSFLFIVLCMAAVFYIAFSNTDLKDAWEAIKQMKIGWLAAIFLCWIVYTFFDGMNYWCYLKGQGFKISIGRAVNRRIADSKPAWEAEKKSSFAGRQKGIFSMKTPP